MPRSAQHDANTPGHDSFLDVVANIVGILIILVIVAGLRTRNATVEAASSGEDIQQEIRALEGEKATAGSLRGEVFKASAQIEDLNRERALRQKERDRMALAVAAWEHRLQSHRAELNADQQDAYDLRLALSKARVQLDQLERERDRAQAAEPAPTRIESLPTPLSKTVDDHEAHFQLRAGRVAFIPMDELIETFKAHARQRANRLLTQQEVTDTVGPQGGFRLRYTMERREIAQASGNGRVQVGSYAQLKRFTLIPVSNELGEPIDEALAPGSRFRQAIAKLDRKRATITIWTYPDSFAEFRRLKEDLFCQGFPTAARPLPHHVPIGGSPQGTKSAAE
jgi:hypothetical protein